MRRDRPHRKLFRAFEVTLGLGCLLLLASRPLVAAESPETGSPRTPKRIVLCLDGTWNSTYAENKRDDGSKVLKPTNVLKLCRGLLPWAPTSRREQIAYYEVGVGSLAEYPGTSNQLLHRVDKFLGGAWGAGFEANIENALDFLVLNYEEGDQVFLFGFSRGAGTARGLTRFLDWAGGLPVKRDAYYLPILFREFVLAKGKGSGQENLPDLYPGPDGAPGKKGLERFKPIQIEFLGVWDTVMALGSRFRTKGGSTSPVSKSFYVDAQPAKCVKNARQALGVDEARYDFRPEIWQGHREGQTLEQRWFPGVHSNVGGGYVNDGLANGAFQWILDEATNLPAATKLEVDSSFTKIYRPFAQGELYDSSSLFYRLLDWLRFRSGKGVRCLVGQPPTAHLSLDRSVLLRLQANPKESRNGKLRFPQMLGKPYRPDNVLLFLACQPDYDPYLAGIEPDPEKRQLPDDVVRRIEELRPQCAKLKARCP